jgi:hypothetical protein
VFHCDLGIRETFREVIFDLGFEGCIRVHQVEIGKSDFHAQRDLRGHVGVW